MNLEKSSGTKTKVVPLLSGVTDWVESDLFAETLNHICVSPLLVFQLFQDDRGAIMKCCELSADFLRHE